MKIDFLKISRLFLLISFFLFFLSLFFLFKNGLNLGLEFAGGLEIEFNSKQFIEINDLNERLKDLPSFKIKYLESNYNVQLKIKDFLKDSDLVINEIKKRLPEFISLVKINHTGPEINKENINNSIVAIFFSIFFMLIYLCFRFNYDMAFITIVTLLHDMVLLIGLISFLKLEFNLLILSSIFTVFGYSVNDTIIVFDRIRENIFLFRDKNFYYIINLSINMTLSRTLITSSSTLLVAMILMFFTSSHIFNFSFIFFIGVIIGTYSSIFIASYLLFFLKTYNKK